MRRSVVIAIVLLASGGAGLAQSPTTMPAIGATSPLGIPGSTASGSSAGIPLGATEIDPGGLSPIPMGTMTNTCGVTGAPSGSPTTGTNSNFDGGGMTGATACASTAGTGASGGLASPLSNPAANTASTLNGGAIPLGATEIGSAGVSPLIGIPTPDSTMSVNPSLSMAPPGSTSSPCTGSTTGASSLTTGSSGVTGLATGSSGTSLPSLSTGTAIPGSISGC